MLVQDFTEARIFLNPLTKEPVRACQPIRNQPSFCSRLAILCLCANFFVGPAFADTASSLKELSEWQKKIKEAAERGDMNLADRNAVGAMQLVSNNPAAYERSLVTWNIFTPVRDLISSYRKNGKYDRANYMTNWLYSTEQKMYGAKSVELVDPMTEFGRTLEAQNKNAEAEARYKQALALADQAPYIDTLAKTKVWTACFCYSELLRKMGRDKESLTVMQSVKKYQ